MCYGNNIYLKLCSVPINFCILSMQTRTVTLSLTQLHQMKNINHILLDESISGPTNILVF